MYRWIQKHLTLRVLKAVSVGVAMSIFNAGVFFVLVDVAGLHPLLTNLLRATATMQIRFIASRYYTWRDRRDESAWVQWRRHVTQEVAGLIVKQLIFMLLLLVGLHYLLAYFMCSMLMAIANYALADRYVFRAKAAT